MLMTVWTTKRCNLACSYCYENKSGSGTLSIRDADSRIVTYLLNNIKENDVIIFHGGEPLLNFGFIKNIVDKISKTNQQCRFGFTTNGTIWADEIEKFLNRYKEKFSEWVSISIDGMPQSHNRNRRYKNGAETFSDVECVCRKLLKIFPDIRARMTVTSENACELAENVNYLVKMGFRKIVPVLDMYDKEWNPEKFMELSKEIDILADIYMEQQTIFIGMLEECKCLRSKKYCRFSLNIYVDGNIYPCDYTVGDEQFLIGNIDTGINDEKRKELLDLICQDNDLCKGCMNLQYCTYNRCKFLNYYAEGDLFTPCIAGCEYENLKYEKMKLYLQEKRI